MSCRPVFIIEDDQDIRQNLKELLEDEGYPVYVAENGLQAIHLLRGSSTPPGLIFVDLQMPVMDGWAFLDSLTDDKDENLRKLGSIPTIVITASEGKAPDIATGFMKKPLNIDQILAVCTQYCSR